MTGTLFGIGVGPGDPELLTLKAVRLIGAAPVIAYPAPLRGDSLARSIAAAHIPGDAVEIALRMPFDPAGGPTRSMTRALRPSPSILRRGRDVAVLCEGDPMFFGSFVYLFARLAERFPVEVVPGVSSLMACAAVLGHPLTARDDALLVIPATRAAADIERLLAGTEAAAIMKPGRHLPKIWRILEKLGLAGQAAYVERAGQPGQRIRSLAEAVRDPSPPYFAMILIHRRGKAWN